MFRGYENEALAGLGNAKVFCIQEIRFSQEAVFLQYEHKLLIDILTDGVVQAGNVLHDDEVGWALGDDPSEFQQQRFFAVVALGCIEGGEGLTRRACGVQYRVSRLDA